MSKILHIDINADVGEGIDNESAIMPYLSSCNVACGGHAGDIDIMTKVVQLAKQHNVKVGAHPSFPDRANFGREVMRMTYNDLENTLVDQIFGVKMIAESYSLKLNHVKLHGALYNLAAVDEELATNVVRIIKSFHHPLKLYVPYRSVISRIAQQDGLEIVYEAFADRNYNDDLSLVSRKKNNAVLTDKYKILNHLLFIIQSQKVKTISGLEVPIKASTFCVHGDTKNAIEILKFLNLELPKHQILIQ
jgi:UPF0271 protein